MIHVLIVLVSVCEPYMVQMIREMPYMEVTVLLLQKEKSDSSSQTVSLLLKSSVILQCSCVSK